MNCTCDECRNEWKLCVFFVEKMEADKYENNKI